MVANHGSLRKKVVCFNNIVSFGLTTNPPKESKGMACDIFLQRIITDSHGASVSFRCHDILFMVFCIGVSRIFTDVFRAIPLLGQLRLMLVATGFTRNIRVPPCKSVAMK